MILMAERTPDAEQRQDDLADRICASCYRRYSWCQSTQVQRLEPHEFNSSSPTWTPADAMGGEGQPNGVHRRQLREAISRSNLKRKPSDAQTGEEVTE